MQISGEVFQVDGKVNAKVLKEHAQRINDGQVGEWTLNTEYIKEDKLLERDPQVIPVFVS